MTETGAEPARAAALELKPLPVASLPAAVQKLLAGPTPVKAMAAKGIAPLRAGELVTAIYQLYFDSDPGVRAAAEAGAANLPDKVVAPALGEPLPIEVLHFFAGKLPADRLQPLEQLLYNPATARRQLCLAGGTFARTRAGDHLSERGAPAALPQPSWKRCTQIPRPACLR